MNRRHAYIGVTLPLNMSREITATMTGINQPLIIDILIKDLEMRAMKRYLDDTPWDLILETLSEDELMELNKYYDMKRNE